MLRVMAHVEFVALIAHDVQELLRIVLLVLMDSLFIIHHTYACLALLDVDDVLLQPLALLVMISFICQAHRASIAELIVLLVLIIRIVLTVQ